MLPNLPTDNLYKFLAISGIVTVAFSGWAGWSLRENLKREEIKARAQWVAFFGDMEAALNKLASRADVKKPLSVQLAMPKKGQSGEPKEFNHLRPGTEFAILTYGDDRKSHRANILRWDEFLFSCLPHREGQVKVEAHLDESTVQTLRNQLREHTTTAEGLWSKADSSSSLQNAASAGLIVGICLTLAGFYLWYARVQSHLDKISTLQCQLAKQGKAIR